MLLAMGTTSASILVKLADRLHTCARSTSPGGAPHQSRRNARHLRADRQSASDEQGEERARGASFRYLEPQPYEALRAKVDAKRRATEGLIAS